jgi:chaperonin GroES
MKLVPLGDKVVLKQVEAEETTKGGIILAAKAQERPQQATVIVVGDGKIDGKEIVMSVKVGDQVVYSKYAGNEFKLGDEEYILCKMSDILAKVE